MSKMLSYAGGKKCSVNWHFVNKSSKRVYSKNVEVLGQRLMESGGQIGLNRGQNDL